MEGLLHAARSAGDVLLLECSRMSKLKEEPKKLEEEKSEKSSYITMVGGI